MVQGGVSDVAVAVFVPGNESWEDIRLMAACKHHIIANSSFRGGVRILGTMAG